MWFCHLLSSRANVPHALQPNTKPDAEGDAFFLDSNDDSSDDRSAGEAPAISAKPAAAEAVTHRKRSHGEISASQALNSLPQQAQKGMAQQVQGAKAQQAQNSVGLQAVGATPLAGPFEQPAAKRQALAGSAHINRAAANRVGTSSMADECGRGSTQQHAGKNRPLALQASHHAVQHSAQAQPMRDSTFPAKASEKRDQSARKDDLGRGKRSRAVSAVNQVTFCPSLTCGYCSCGHSSGKVDECAPALVCLVCLLQKSSNTEPMCVS